MYVKLSRFCKGFIALISSFVIVFCGICLTSFLSNASGSSTTSTFNVNYSQPYVSDYAGYLSVMYYQSVNPSVYRLYTYFWTINPNGSTNYSTNVFAQMDIEIDQGRIIFMPWCHTDSSYFVTLSAYDYNDNLHILDTINVSTVNGYVRQEDFSNCTIVGYTYGGNVSLTAGTSLRDMAVPNIQFNGTQESAQMTSYLYQIMTNIGNVDVDTSEIISWLDWIYYEVDTVEEQLVEMKNLLDSLLTEQEETNSWLEKIFNKITEALGLESNESMESLPDDDVNSVIEDEDALMQDTTQAENSLDFSIDSNSNNVVWNIIDRVLNSNSRVFGAFVGIMTLGVITLLLNR